MATSHRLIQVTSHVTSFVGRVGVLGLCSCGWLGGEEDDDTRRAVLRLNGSWEQHARTAVTTEADPEHAGPEGLATPTSYLAD
jgi:hypothetical protein